jgi:hypothetical protein
MAGKAGVRGHGQRSAAACGELRPARRAEREPPPSTCARRPRTLRADRLSKAMSASRISPLRGSTWLGPMAPKPGRRSSSSAPRRSRSPACRRASSGCCSRRWRCLKPIFSKALFHSRMAGAHGLAVGQRHVAVDPEGDGLDRLDISAAGSFFSSRQRLTWRWRGVRARSSLKSSTVVVNRPTRGSAAARRHRLGGQRRQRVVQADEQAARVGQEARAAAGAPARPGARRPGHAAMAAGVEVLCVSITTASVVAAHAGDRRSCAVQAVALRAGRAAASCRCPAGRQEQRVGSTSTLLRSGCGWLATGACAQQAGRVGAGHGARLGRAGLGHDLGVARLQPHLVVHAHELHHLRPPAPLTGKPSGRPAPRPRRCRS